MLFIIYIVNITINIIYNILYIIHIIHIIYNILYIIYYILYIIMLYSNDNGLVNNVDIVNDVDSNNILKRKIDEENNNSNNSVNCQYKIYSNYSNPLNCDRIVIQDNHIYFNALINKETISTLILYIRLFIKNMSLFNNKTIYIHITSKGGQVKYIMDFIEFKKICIVELFSIIEKECADSGILLAASCNYRIINKNAKCSLSKLSDRSYFWNYFQQCLNNHEEITYLKTIIYYILCDVIDSKITKEKLEKYFEKNCFWDAKKYKKLGLADEII
jgi:ATP-dependent protease ClpP protease subunit